MRSHRATTAAPTSTTLTVSQARRNTQREDQDRALRRLLKYLVDDVGSFDPAQPFDHPTNRAAELATDYGPGFFTGDQGEPTPPSTRQRSATPMATRAARRTTPLAAPKHRDATTTPPDALFLTLTRDHTPAIATTNAGATTSTTIHTSDPS